MSTRQTEMYRWDADAVGVDDAVSICDAFTQDCTLPITEG